MFKPVILTVIIVVLAGVGARAESSGKIVFLGDSLTAYTNWDTLFSNDNITNRGIGGNTSRDIYNRLGTVIEDAPKKVFIMVGINDIIRGKSMQELILTYDKILDVLTNRLPDAEIYVMSILPVNFEGDDYFNYCVTIANRHIKQIVDKYDKKDKVIYLDIYGSFVSGGTTRLNPLFTQDGIHLTQQGYLNWKRQLQPYVY
jgi:lysophospholipase L1-like esterase